MCNVYSGQERTKFVCVGKLSCSAWSLYNSFHSVVWLMLMKCYLSYVFFDLIFKTFLNSSRSIALAKLMETFCTNTTTKDRKTVSGKYFIILNKVLFLHSENDQGIIIWMMFGPLGIFFIMTHFIIPWMEFMSEKMIITFHARVSFYARVRVFAQEFTVC